MEIEHNIESDTLTIALRGKFTFADQEEFKSLFSSLEADDIKHCLIDSSELEFVDSAALGLFLLLREQAEKHDVKLVLKSPSGQVKQMFDLSRFPELFTIED
tara:strand:- start:2694 stop:2999 length:306 start_codon:yes stop_codon:yes gene_type:complete